MHAFNLGTQEVERGGSLGVGDPYGLQNEFQDRQDGNTERSCPEKPKPNQTNKNK